MTLSHAHADAADAELRTWLTERLAHYLRIDAAGIDEAVPLTRYDTDSILALILCCDLEDEFRLATEPTLLWDHPTVTALAAHLAPQLAAARGGEP